MDDPDAGAGAAGRSGQGVESIAQATARPRTVSLTRLTDRSRELARVLEPNTDYGRPQTRADCVNGERPCPFVGCKWHLALDVDVLAIKFNFPVTDAPDEIAFEKMPDTCVLDVADRGETTGQDVANRLNVTRQRIQQLETAALPKLRRRLEFLQDDAEAPVHRHLALVQEPQRLHSPIPLKRPANLTVLAEIPVFTPPERPIMPLHLVDTEDPKTSAEEEEAAKPEPRTVLCANEGCGLRFTPTGNNQRYCEPCGKTHHVANKRQINRDKMRKNRQKLRELRAAANQIPSAVTTVPTPPATTVVAPLGSKKLTSIREEEVFTRLHEIFSQLGLTVTWAGLMEREPSGKRTAIYIVRPTAGDQVAWPMPDAMEDFEQFIPLLGYEWLGSTMALDPNAETWAVVIAFTPARLR